jgi:hypothetical protein
MPTKRIDTRTSASLLTPSGLSAKAVTDVVLHQHGSVTCFEIVFSGGSTFLKDRQGLVEIGGTLDWGTGTPAF